MCGGNEGLNSVSLDINSKEHQIANIETSEVNGPANIMSL